MNSLISEKGILFFRSNINFGDENPPESSLFKNISMSLNSKKKKTMRISKIFYITK